MNRAPTPRHGAGRVAEIEKTVDIPIGIAGLRGVIRATVLRDQVRSGAQLRTPLLVPASFLEAIGATIDLYDNTLTSRWGRQCQLRRLNSKRRSVNVMDYGNRPWSLPQVHRGRDGSDPFCVEDYFNMADNPPVLQMTPAVLPTAGPATMSWSPMPSDLLATWRMEIITALLNVYILRNLYLQWLDARKLHAMPLPTGRRRRTSWCGSSGWMAQSITCSTWRDLALTWSIQRACSPSMTRTTRSRLVA